MALSELLDRGGSLGRFQAPVSALSCPRVWLAMQNAGEQHCPGQCPGAWAPALLASRVQVLEVEPLTDRGEGRW